MKSAFGSKRKARKIQVDEEDDEIPDVAVVSKPLKKSSLRQSLVFDDIQQASDEVLHDTGGDNRSSRPPSAVNVGGSTSTVKKKKKTASRLSFGPGEIISGDAAEALGDDETYTPKKSALGRRFIDSSALRKSLPYGGGDDDDQRPTYSKDYLNQLKSSTPTMRNSNTVDDEEDASLDLSALDGATIVDLEGLDAPYIPSEAEIKEKKERRARLANEQDFISLEDNGSSNHTLSLLPRKKKAESRLVREDEDLGEGFDEFVEDGRIALGKKQERAAKKAHRKELAEQIRLAEGIDDEESDDSEADRNAAYEAAQTRAGMDGLHKITDEAIPFSQVPSRITPIPVLSDCLERLRTTLDAMEQDIVRRQKQAAELEQEKQEIIAREIEVQELMRKAGEKYATLTDTAVVDLGNALTAQNQSPLVADRGLESFGHTPIVRSVLRDVN